MLIIRKEQMTALNSQARRRFIDRTVAHLRELFPQQAGTREVREWVTFVEQGIQRARHYKITRERDVTLFIDLQMGLGAEFDTQPAQGWVQSILRRADLGSSEKMDLIYAQLASREVEV